FEAGRADPVLMPDQQVDGGPVGGVHLRGPATQGVCGGLEVRHSCSHSSSWWIPAVVNLPLHLGTVGLLSGQGGGDGLAEGTGAAGQRLSRTAGGCCGVTVAACNVT